MTGYSTVGLACFSSLLLLLLLLELSSSSRYTEVNDLLPPENGLFFVCLGKVFKLMLDIALC